MRLTTAIIGIAALGAAAFIAVGIFHHYSTSAPEGIAGSPASGAPTTATRSEKGFSFQTLEIPRPLPELRFVDGEGREMTLKAFEGQTVLLNIWATWCVPCRKEMPALDRLQSKLGGPDFRVVALSIDREGLPAVTAFYQELGLKTLGIYVDQTGKASRQLGVVGIPTTLLLDREGREIGRTVGPAEWDSDAVVQVLEKHVKPEAAARRSGPGSE
ncbi:MAG: TlpA family protein disulfide reductase [Rhodospirillales bacterium]|nr:TlpA family protein disulfide reductase [Rhodospirillales bacterium]